MTAPDPVVPPAPLSPPRIGTSVAMIVGGLALALFARATYRPGLRLTELKWTAIAIYGTSALALLALAIPVAHGRTWATRVAALAAITPAGLWLITRRPAWGLRGGRGVRRARRAGAGVSAPDAVTAAPRVG
ncbi:MAG: hypothetical protein IPH80_11320 [Myxococcales bacterium]|nr:hypothetical protein [Myxococcales bacterium]